MFSDIKDLHLEKKYFIYISAVITFVCQMTRSVSDYKNVVKNTSIHLRVISKIVPDISVTVQEHFKSP